MANIWDVLNKSVEGAIKTAANNQNAQNTLKSTILLYKIKGELDKKAKNEEMETKHGLDLAMEKEKSNLMTPYQRMMMEWWNKQQTQPQGEGSPQIVPGAKGFQAVSPQAITDAEGNVIGYRPKGSIFQPKGSDEEPMFKTDNPTVAPLTTTPATPNTPSNQIAEGTIISNGKQRMQLKGGQWVEMQ